MITPTSSAEPPRWLRLLSIPFGVVPGLGHIVLGKALRGFLFFFAFIADALAEKDAFARTYATYLELPRRPASLDTVLAEAAARR